MRILRLDEYEFDGPESEQELVLCQSGVYQFENPEAFFLATCKLAAFETVENLLFPPARNFSEAMNGRFYDILNKESSLSLRGDMAAHVIVDDWNYFDVVVVDTNDGQFVRLRWSTSA